MPSTPPPPLPPTFTSLKRTILAHLSAPLDQYTDLSPKGSLDLPIVGLIERINGKEGWVSTSSCSGRLSVFVEGRGASHGYSGGSGGDGDGEDGEGAVVDGAEERGEEEGEGEVEGKEGEGAKGEAKGKGNPGGKGMGGRWLFVSHEPVSVEEGGGRRERLTRMFGLARASGGANSGTNNNHLDPDHHQRYVRFAFEPMVSHTSIPREIAPLFRLSLQNGILSTALIQSISEKTPFGDLV